MENWSFKLLPKFLLTNCFVCQFNAELHNIFITSIKVSTVSITSVSYSVWF
jgi:hypothetical protein